MYFCVLDNLGPDIQYHINGVAPYSDFGAFFHKIFGFEGDWWKEFYGPHYAQDAVTILPIVLHPQRFILMQPYPGIILPHNFFLRKVSLCNSFSNLSRGCLVTSLACYRGSVTA